MLRHNLAVLLFIFLHVITTSCHKTHISKNMSTIHVRQLRKFNYTFNGPVDNCKNSERQIELKSEKIQIFCEHFQSLGDKMIVDSYIQSTSGTNFRHCRANARKMFNNSCFDIPFDKDEWRTHAFLRLNTTKIGNGDAEKNHRCRYRKPLGLSSGDVERWFWKQPKCYNRRKVGYLGMPNDVKRHEPKPPIYNFQGLADCSDKKVLPKDQINWKNIDMFCYHFKDYPMYRSAGAEMYFKAIGDRGTFQFCHSITHELTSNCFPGPWDGWKKWTFENGEVHGERSYGFLTVNNVHCYSKDGIMGDINGMKNWYKENERNCDTLAWVGFHNFDRDKINW